MFKKCTSLSDFSFLKIFNTDSLSSLTSMFEDCTNISELDLSKFNTKNIYSINSLFKNNKNLKKLNINDFSTSKMVYMNEVFKGCEKLTSLDISKWDTSNVENMTSMFEGMTSLEKINLINFRTYNVLNFNYFMKGCSNLKEVDISRFDTSSVESMNESFYGLEKLAILDVSGFDLTNCKYYENMISLGPESIVRIYRETYEKIKDKNDYLDQEKMGKRLEITEVKKINLFIDEDEWFKPIILKDTSGMNNYITEQYFTNRYKAIIKEKDKSFYKKNDQGNDYDNFKFVMHLYSTNDYEYLNNYMLFGKAGEKYSEAELKSWAWCLHSSLTYTKSNVDNGIILYRGVSGIQMPENFKVGTQFYIYLHLLVHHII